MKIFRFLLPLLLALLFLAPLSDARVTKRVFADDYSFSPGTVRIKRGDSVRWIFREGNHNVVGRGWGRAQPQDSGTYMKRFSRAGRYPYTCTLHPGMDGVVRVRR